MKLSLQEQAFVEKTCNIYKDARLADELTRIRFEMGIKDAKPTSSVNLTDGAFSWYPGAGGSSTGGGFFVNSGAGGSDDRAYFFNIANTGAFNANEETWFTIEWNSSNATFTLNFTK